MPNPPTGWATRSTGGELGPLGCWPWPTLGATTASAPLRRRIEIARILTLTG
jgi:hypothetical protein